MAHSDVANLVELIPCAALLYSGEDTIVAANRAFCELTGYPPAELAGRPVAELTAWQDRQQDRTIRAMLRDGAQLTYRKRFIGSTGTIIFCDVALKRIAPDEAGGVDQYLALLHNVDVRQPADIAADSLQRASELILHAIDEGFVLLDRDFRIQCINDEALRIDGRPRDAIIGRTHWEIWPGSEQLPLADAYRKAMRERIHITVDQLYRHNGRDMWIEARAYPFGDNLAVFYRIITERKLAERAIRESEATFRTLAENIPQLAWMADSSGYIFWYNSRWFEYTGATFEQMRGWGWRQVHHPDHVERVVALYRERIVEQQRVWEDTFPLRGADGQYRWFLSRAIPIRDQGGAVVRWLGTNTDITLQREAEEALQQANQRKDDFLALLAHELRSPLAPISTAAHLLKAGDGNPENIRRSSEIIDRQVRHLSDLVNDLMDVSRVTRGLVSISQDEVSVAAVVHGAVEQSRPLIEARRQALVVNLHADGATVLGDHTRLVQVLANLLNNAAKYTPQLGRIALTTALHGNEVAIAVADNGIGMDAALLPHLFELFTQAERNPDRNEGGLGLGLALVKSIVTLHHGRVTASSDGRGLGSTFTVTLPLLHTHGGQPGAPPAGGAPGQGLHILLVDRADDGDAALPAALQEAGHTVALCPDEASALACAAELKPDAVLIRTDLPGVEGYALARQLRSLQPEPPATFIALDGSGQSHDKVIARGAGFDYQLERPVALAALKRLLPAARRESGTGNTTPGGHLPDTDSMRST